MVIQQRHLEIFLSQLWDSPWDILKFPFYGNSVHIRMRVIFLDYMPSQRCLQCLQILLHDQMHFHGSLKEIVNFFKFKFPIKNKNCKRNILTNDIIIHSLSILKHFSLQPFSCHMSKDINPIDVSTNRQIAMQTYVVTSYVSIASSIGDERLMQYSQCESIKSHLMCIQIKSKNM